ncbi:MAG: hypothetical protein ACRDVW_11835 [Acidimicrobiales bacterium]
MLGPRRERSAVTDGCECVEDGSGRLRVERGDHRDLLQPGVSGLYWAAD